MLWNDDHLNEYTNFCGKRCLRLLKSERGESKLSAYIRQRCNFLLDLNRNLHWPGEKPIALTRVRMPSFVNSKYFVAPKTDGERHWLIFGKSADYRYVFIALVNTKYEVFLIQLKAPQCLFRWTVLDGELVKQNEKWTFVVFDCLCFKGINFTSWHFENRLQVAKECVALIESTESSPFDVKVKEFFTLGQTSLQEVERSAGDGKVDGFIFVKNCAPMVPYFSTTTYKLKPSDRATADFFLGITQDGKSVELVVVGEVIRGIPQPLPYATQNLEFTSRKCSTNKKVRLQSQGIAVTSGYSLSDYCAACADVQPVSQSMSLTIMECIYCPHDKLWKPYRQRTDKGYPNKKITVDEAKQSVYESITFEECNELAKSQLFTEPCCVAVKSELKPSQIKERVPWGLFQANQNANHLDT